MLMVYYQKIFVLGIAIFTRIMNTCSTLNIIVAFHNVGVPNDNLFEWGVDVSKGTQTFWQLPL